MEIVSQIAIEYLILHITRKYLQIECTCNHSCIYVISILHVVRVHYYNMLIVRTFI